MNDQIIEFPYGYKDVWKETQRIKFSMASDHQTGSLLRTLITSKPGGDFLELGTGTGLSLAWIVEALDEKSKVISVDNNPELVNIANGFFGKDQRVSIVCQDGGEWIQKNQHLKFDLIFADAWPGKYSFLDEVLAMVKPGGFYIIDDMLHQPNWPEGHDKNVEKLLSYLESLPDIRFTKLNWSTGLVIVSKME